MATFRNAKSGEQVNSPYTDEQAAAMFAEHFKGQDHWIKFWLHKLAVEQSTSTGTPNNAIAFLCDSFLLAIGYGLKRPMLRVHFRDQRFKVYLSAKGTLCLKSGKLTAAGTSDPKGREEYVGCFLRGSFLPAKNSDNRTGFQGRRYGGRYGSSYNSYSRQATRDEDSRRTVRQLLPVEVEFLVELSKDVAGFLAKCSKDMCRCCYCGLPLEDARSKACGYGQTCAKHWGLPWGEIKAGEKAPNFARDWNATAHGLCDVIRNDPKNVANWEIFSDWLQERGLPRTKTIEGNVVLPRNDSGASEAVKVQEKETSDPVVITPVPAPKPVESDVLPWEKPSAPVVVVEAPKPCCNGNHSTTPKPQGKVIPAPWTVDANGTYVTERAELEENQRGQGRRG